MDNPFPVILVAGLTVFGLAIIGAQDFDLSTDDRESVTLFEENIGEVGQSQQDSRTERFGDFTVGDLRGDVQVYRSDRDEISNSLLSSQTIDFNYEATQPREGKVEFEVLGRNGQGAVFVEVNGERVFEEAMISEANPEIEIPSGSFQNGDNSVVIGTTKGGWFSSASYDIRDVEVTVNDRKFHDYRNSFQMYDYELQDFVESRLTFTVESSVMNNPLRIEINGNEVYSENLPRVTGKEVEIDPDEADLNPGRNTVKFSTGRDSEYIVNNAALTVRYVGTTETRTVNKEFGVNQSNMRFVDQEESTEYLRFDHQSLLPSPRDMSITLNNASNEFTPRNGRNSWELPEGTIKEENLITIRSNGTYQMSGLRVTSERRTN